MHIYIYIYTYALLFVYSPMEEDPTADAAIINVTGDVVCGGFGAAEIWLYRLLRNSGELYPPWEFFVVFVHIKPKRIFRNILFIENLRGV